MTPLHPNPQFGKECWSPTVPKGFCCNINSSLSYKPDGSRGRSPIAQDRRGLLKKGIKNIWRFWSWCTHSNCTQVPGHSGGCGQKSQRGLSPWLLPTAARKNWAWEQRSDILQAPQKPECRKLKNERRNRCKLQNEQMSTCRSSQTKLREIGGYQPYKITAPTEE